MGFTVSDPVDPIEFLAREREGWDIAAAGWRRWWGTFEAGAQPLNDRLVELAAVCSGHRCLDVATGIGEPALTAARATGPSGRVIAVDMSTRMLEFGRLRAAEAGLDHVDFVAADAEQLDVEAGSIDAATCRWGLMLMLRPALVAQNVRAALRPGGRFAVSVWGTADEVPFIGLGPRVIRGLLGGAAPALEEPGPFRLADPEELRGVLRQGGFSGVEVEERRVVMSFASPADYVTFVGDLSGTFRDAMAPLDESMRVRVLGALEEAAAAFSGSDGGVRFDNRVLCAVGTAG